MDPWPTEVFGFPVSKEPLRTDNAALKDPTVLVLHTTETSGPVGSYPHPPHFEVSAAKIRQFVSLDQRAEALVGFSGGGPFSPNEYAVQIEIVAFSQQALWRPSKGTADRLGALVAYISDYHAIPLAVPKDWPDDCSDMPPPWASNNRRRQWADDPNGNLRNYPVVRGVWMHLEVPWQSPTWHWDCGALRRTEILDLAKSHLQPKEEDLGWLILTT